MNTMTTKNTNDLFNTYSFLVRRVVNNLSRKYPDNEDKEDMAQYGYIGLINAIKRFDPEKGISFESYATIRIQGSIIDAKRKEDWVPRSIRAKVKDITYVQQDLAKKLRREPTAEEMAQELNISVPAFMKLRGRLDTRAPLRLDQESDDGFTLGSLLPSQESNPEEKMFANDMIARLQQAQSTLTEREKALIQWYYYDGINFKEISKRLGITESRVSQIHSNLCTLLRKRIAA